LAIVSYRGSNQRSGSGSEGDGCQHRRPQRQCDSRNSHPNGPLVEHQVPIFPKGLCDHEGRKQRRRDRHEGKSQTDSDQRHRNRPPPPATMAEFLGE
jgi:hypothetical protein